MNVLSSRTQASAKPRAAEAASTHNSIKWTGLKVWLHSKAMSSHRDYRPPGQQNKLVSEPPLGVLDDKHAQLVEADQRFQAALEQAIAAGGERKEAVEATVALKKRRKPSP